MADPHRDLVGFIARMSPTREEFVSDNPWPFIVRLPDKLPTADPSVDGFTYNTEVGDSDNVDDAVVIQAVKKRPRGLFPMRVSVGRTRSCDVALRFSSVSKLHAQFHVDEPQWTIVDMDSANGTFVDGERLLSKKLHLVSIGSRLRFGAIETELLGADEVFDRLRKLRA